jgi:hypothetical protein
MFLHMFVACVRILGRLCSAPNVHTQYSERSSRFGTHTLRRTKLLLQLGCVAKID